MKKKFVIIGILTLLMTFLFGTAVYADVMEIGGYEYYYGTTENDVVPKAFGRYER